MIKAGIIGATGYAGNEIVRLLLGHKDVEIKWFGSRSYIDQQYAEIKAQGLALDMSRGKPSVDQLNISMDMMDVLSSSTDLRCETGVDCRNYGVLDGIKEAKQIRKEVKRTRQKIWHSRCDSGCVWSGCKCSFSGDKLCGK